jgi:clan AA aspartic protease
MVSFLRETSRRYGNDCFYWRKYDKCHKETSKTCFSPVIGYYGGKTMGYVFTEVTLKNSRDTTDVVRGDIKESEVRQKTVQALVDSGHFSLIINEELRQELGLEIQGKKGITLADNMREICSFTEAVEIHWKDRDMMLSALVIPDSPHVLLGTFILGYMDLVVDPVRQELTGCHGGEWVIYI